MNFDEIKTELRSRLGNRADLDTRMNRWINYAYQELLMNPRFQFFELDSFFGITTIQGTDTYDLPANFWFILDVRDMDNERKLRRSHWSYIDKISRFQGAPIRYYRFGPSIVFQPIPDLLYNIQVRYRIRPNDLASGTKFNGLGNEWEEPIVTLASIKGFEALQLKEEAAGARQLLEGMLNTRFDVPGLEDYDSETTVEATIIPRV